MRTILILGVVALVGCVGDASAEFGGEAVGVGSGDAASSTAVGVGGAGGGEEAKDSTSSSSSGGAGGSDVAGPSSSSSSAVASSSSSGVVEPPPECEGAVGGTPCNGDGWHFCDGYGSCQIATGIQCKASDGVTYTCGDGTPRDYVIVTDHVNCKNTPSEFFYCITGEDCSVKGMPGVCVN